MFDHWSKTKRLISSYKDKNPGDNHKFNAQCKSPEIFVSKKFHTREFALIHRKIFDYNVLNRFKSIFSSFASFSLLFFINETPIAENNLRQTLDTHNRLVRARNSLVWVEQILSRLLLVDRPLGKWNSSKNTVTRAHHFRPVERKRRLVRQIDSISFYCAKFRQACITHVPRVR